MSTRFYYGQKDYIVQLNLMDDVATASATSAAGQATLAQKWATQSTGEVVTGQGYSAYYWAQQASGSATTAATAATIALQNVGWAGVAASPLIANMDDATAVAGMYYVNGTTTGTFPTGSALSGIVLQKIYGGSGLQIYQPYGSDRMFWRRRASNAWQAWNEYASLTNALRVDAAQGLTTGQQAQGRSNLGLAAISASGSYSDLSGIPTPEFAQSYSVPTATGVAITVPGGGTALTSGMAYRVTLSIGPTSTPTGAVFLATPAAGGAGWTITASATAGEVSNHPLLRLNGTTLEVYHNHASTYTIFAKVQAYNTGNNYGATTIWGIEGVFSSRSGVPAHAGNTILHAGNYSTYTDAALANLGLGIATSTTYIADLDSTTQGAGTYYVSATSTTGTFPGGSAIAGAVLHKVYGSGGFQLFSSMTNDRMFFRRRVSSVWQAWNEVANLNSPVFTGDPQAPTPAMGDNDTSVATTAFVNSMTNAIYSKSVAGGSQVTLTAIEASYPIIKLTGALTANINVVVPSVSNKLIIWNATTGAFAVTVKTSAGTGLVVTQGTTSSLMCDGTNVMDANNDTANIALTGVPTTPDATSGTSTSQIANTKFVTTGLAAKADLAGNVAQDFASKNLTALSMNTGPLAGFRNLIINGRMQIDQRNEGNLLTLAANGAGFSADRWKCINTRASGTISFQRINTGSVRPFWIKSLNNTATALAAGDNVALFQCIEGFSLAGLNWGTAAAKAITVSFWVNASIVGTYAVAFRNGAVNRSYVATFTVNAANTDQLVTLTIPGDTTGTWTSGSGVGLYMSFDLGVGSTYNTGTYGAWQAGNFFGGAATVKLTGTANATFNVTEAQMEVGPQATPYEALPIGVELLRCQRFYAKTFAQGMAPAGNAGSGGALFFSGTGNVSFWGALWRYPVTMRTAPTMTFYNVSTGGAGWRDIATNTDSAATTIAPGDAGVFVLANNGAAYSAGAGSAYYIHVTAEAEL